MPALAEATVASPAPSVQWLTSPAAPAAARDMTARTGIIELSAWILVFPEALVVSRYRALSAR